MTRPSWPHRKKNRRRADRNRQRKHRAKFKRLVDLLRLPQPAMRDLLDSRSIPEDIERALTKVAIRYREEIRRRHARYAKQPGPLHLVLDPDCINTFLFVVPTGQRACMCPGKDKGCPRRDA
jgi:hypothetical protein